MQASVGNQPLLTVNEARDQFMGLGPVDGGDVLMSPTMMAPAGQPNPDAGDVAPQAENDPNAKHIKLFKPESKAANGLRVGYRPARTKLQALAKRRAEQRDSLSEKIKADLEAKLNAPAKKFESTKEQDEQRWKEWSEYVTAAEKDINETMQKINGEQKKEVLQHLPNVVKAVNPADLFSKEKWISITVDAIAPIAETLFSEQAKIAAAEVGGTFDFTQATREAVHESVQMMSESYQQTTLNALESHINDGLQAGESLADITKRVEQVYEWSDNSRAKAVATTESFRSANSALKTAWQQSGVVKTVRWYTAEDQKVCPFCSTMDGKTIPIDDVFFKNGDSLSATDANGAEHSMTLDYGDVSFPPLHVSCRCFIRPDQISI
jgi:SPP1 gp7 family putative phage head morphogenesis protein